MGLTHKTLTPHEVVLEGRTFDSPPLSEVFIDSVLKFLKRVLTNDEVATLVQETHSRRARISLRRESQDFLVSCRPLRTRVPAAFCPLSTFSASGRSSSMSAIRAWRLSVMVAMCNSVLHSDYKGGRKDEETGEPTWPGVFAPERPGQRKGRTK